MMRQKITTRTAAGRWADWRIMDLLSERVVEDTWRWCGKVGLRWVGQLMARDGRSLLSRRGWLRLLDVHDAPRAAVTVHEAMASELRGGGWLVSPLAVRGLDDFKALRTGQENPMKTKGFLRQEKKTL